MNKIFKIIWSKARNCYVVVSELAKSHDDGHVRRSRSGCCRKAAVLAAFVLTTSLAVVPVWAADSKGNINNVVTIKDNQQDISVMAGSNNLNGTGNVVYGTGNTADKSGAVIVGKNSKGDKNSVIIGNDAQSNAENQIIIGHGIANGTAEGSIIIGNTNNTVDTSQSVLIGNNTKANGSGKGIVIIGNEAMADSKAAGYTTDNGRRYIPAGIVLGEYSYSGRRAGRTGYVPGSTNNTIPSMPSTAYTPEFWSAVWTATANPLAIGDVDDDSSGKGEAHNKMLVTRQITGVAAGSALTDAVNVAQLQEAIASVNPGGGSGTGGDGVHFYSVKETDSSKGNYNNKGATGTDALAAGVDAKATGNYATAVGNNAQALKDNAVAIGNGAVANGTGATVIGQYAQATGDYATAFGGKHYYDARKGEVTLINEASGIASTAFGEGNKALGEASLAFGLNTQAGTEKAGQQSVAFGEGTKALGGRSLAFGERTLASFTNSVAFGADTQARSNGATAFGSRTRALAQYSTAMGNRAVAAGNYAVAFGTDTIAGVKTDESGALTLINDTKIDSNGNIAYVDGQGKTYAVHDYSVKDGETHDYVVVTGTDGKLYIQDYRGNIHAVTIDDKGVATASTEGANVTLNVAGPTSSAGYTLKSYDNATAFGQQTKATNKNATAFGENSEASGEASTAFGIGSKAEGKNSLAALGGLAANDNSIAIGEGTKANNADKAVSVAIGQNAEASGERSLAIGFGVSEKVNDKDDTTLTSTKASGESAIAIGTDVVAKGQHSVAMGSHTDAAKDSSVAIGFDTHTVSDSAVAIGSGTRAEGRYSVALGLSSVAGKETNDAKNPLDGGGSVAIGYGTSAEASRSVAIGTGATAADSQFTTAVGDSTTAQAEGSVAIGAGSIATRGAGNKESTASTDVNTGKTTITYGDEKKAYLKPDNLSTDKASTWVSTTGAVSVGGQATYKEYDDTGKLVKKAKLLTRQITNVAAGSDDTDAVNVAQLKAAQPTVTSNDHSVTINPTTDSTDYHKNYDLKIATATLSKETTTGDNPVETGKIAVKNPTYTGSDGKPVTNENAYVTGKSVADAINNSGFNLLASKSEGDVTGNAKTLIHPGDTVTIDAGKNISLTQENGKISIATKDNLNLGSADSKDDKQQDVPGTDGSITVNGTNGSSVAINGQDGSIGLTGPKGKDGTSTSIQMSTILSTPTLDDGKNITTTSGEGEQQTTTTQAPRIQYKNGDTTYEVATMDDGMKYAGNFGDGASVKLNKTVTIKGKVKDGAKEDDFVDGNIAVVANKSGEDGELLIKLNKDLTGLNSSSYATTTKIDGKDVISKTVVDGTGLKIENGPSITNTGIDGGKHQITNVASGKDGKMYDTTVEGHKNWNNAANIGDVTNIAKSAADGVQAKSGKNITVDANNKVNLNDNITLGDDKDKTKQVSIDGNGAKITAGDGNNKVTVDGSKGQIVAGGVKVGNIANGDSSLTIYDKDGKATDKKADGGKFVTNLGNKTWNKDGSYVSGRAATEDQLHQLESSFNTKVDGVEQNHTAVTVNGSVEAPDAGANGTLGNYTDEKKGNLLLAQKKDSTGKITYDLKLNDEVTLGKAGKDGVDGSIGLKGADGKSSVGLNGKDGISVIGTDGKNGVSITGSNGKDGIDGKIAIGTPGKDGQPGKDAVSISGKDGIGHIGLTGQKGADGKDGIFSDLSTILGTATLDPAKNEQSKSKDTVSADDKSSRIQYQTTITDNDGKTKTVITHEVATMDDGMKYAGNFGDGASVKLNKTVTIKGKVKDGAKEDDFVDGNIAVVANKSGEDGELLIKLNKDLTGLNSSSYATTTKIDGKDVISKTVVDGTGLKIENGPSITNTGIDGGKHQITNVASGKDGKMYDTTVEGHKNWNNAANIGDVTNIAKSAADGVQAKSGKNITVDANNKVNLNDNITLGDDKDKTKQVSIDGNGAKITAGDGNNKVTVDGSKGQIVAGGVKVGNIANGDSSLTIYDKDGKATDKKADGGKFVTNLGNKTWNKDGSYVSGRAATEDQLHQLESSFNTKVDGVEQNHTAVTVNGSVEAPDAGANGTLGNYTDEKKGNLLLAQKKDSTGKITYDLKLNDEVTLGKAGKDGVDGSIGLKGADGKSSVGLNGKDGISVIGTDGKNGVSITGSNGKDGIDGKITIGTPGKDGRPGKDAISISGQNGEGHIGLTGAAGKDGKNATADIHVVNGQVGVDGTDGHGGTDGMDRVVYEDHNGTPHEVATMDDGMKYGDDFGNTAKVKLNHQLDIVGDINAGKKDGDKKATKDDLSDGNIGIIATDTTYNDDGTVKENGKMTVKLAKDLKGLNSIESNSVTTGNTTINNGGLTIKTGDENRNITVQDGNVNMGGNQIHNVAPGQAPGDAVNVSQLNATNSAVNKLGNRINRVGAGAAALAALHPLDFDPDDKWDFAAGYGNYRGANAAAIGAYYRPNEDTMFSVGGSFGGGENMVNAGVSIKLGQGNHVSTSRVAMAKEMKAMRQHMAEQDALIAKLQSMHGMAVDPAKSVLFPDVAENHWAYQYVTTLAKKGILEGYPDGEFKGDCMMTRYEFAAIVYRIVESGVGSTDPELSKLVKEFSPELQYIRIDTIQKDRNGKPTIERVRVISDAK